MTTEPTASPVGDADESLSIVDQILDLDAVLSADVRRAEKIARFCTRPDLEGRLDDLEAEYKAAGLGRRARPGERRDSERSLADAAAGEDHQAGSGRSAEDVAEEIAQVRAEYHAAMRTVRMRQLSDDDWWAFRERWKDELRDTPPYPRQLFNELISACAIAPKMTVDQVQRLRSHLGGPPMDQLGATAWELCAASGVSVPKSSSSSDGLPGGSRYGS